MVLLLLFLLMLSVALVTFSSFGFFSGTFSACTFRYFLLLVVGCLNHKYQCKTTDNTRLGTTMGRLIKK